MSAIDIDAARVAMLSLYASLAEPAEIDATRARIDSIAGVLSWEQAAIRLSNVKKPVQCTAAAYDRILNVKCAELTGDWLAVYQYRLADLVELTETLRSLAGDRADERAVLVRAGHLSMATTVETVVAWVRSYVVTGPLSVTTRASEGDERGGAPVVIEFSASEKLDLESDLAEQFREMMQRRHKE